eukprot:822483-Pleurochrysis_carterae.AAC.1
MSNSLAGRKPVMSARLFIRNGCMTRFMREAISKHERSATGANQVRRKATRPRKLHAGATAANAHMHTRSLARTHACRHARTRAHEHNRPVDTHAHIGRSCPHIPLIKA